MILIVRTLKAAYRHGTPGILDRIVFVATRPIP